MELRLSPPELIYWAPALTLVVPVAFAGLLVAWRGRGAMPRAWVVAIALQTIVVGDAVAASRSVRADDDQVESIIERTRGGAHTQAAWLFARAGAAVLALAAAAAALGGGVRGASEGLRWDVRGYARVRSGGVGAAGRKEGAGEPKARAAPTGGREYADGVSIPGA